jgi:hypothetical protein
VAASSGSSRSTPTSAALFCAGTRSQTPCATARSSSAIAHHLTLLRGEILKKMAPLLPPGMVTDIRTRVGRIEQRGEE